MTDHARDSRPASEKGEKGEGNYTAAREFQDAQHEFAKDEDRVRDGAREAADALDGSEASELERARRESANRGAA